MKKLIITGLTFVLIVMLFSFSASAQNVYNITSEDNILGITDEEKNIIDPYDENNIVKIYHNGSFYSFFVDGDNINRIIENAPEKVPIIYLKSSKIYSEDAVAYTIDNGVLVAERKQDMFLIDNAINFINSYDDILKTSNVTKDIYEDIVVNRVYCVDAWGDYGTTNMYISTNMGNYICFQEYTGSNNIYLMTVEEYSNVAMLISQKIMENYNKIQETGNVIMIGYVSATSVADLSAYQVKPEDSNNENSELNSESVIITDGAINTEDISTETAAEKQNGDLDNKNNNENSAGCTSSFGALAIIPIVAVAIAVKNKKED